MAASLASIRTALGNALGAISGLTVYTTETGTVQAPAAVILTPDVDYHTSFNGGAGKLNTYTFRIVVCVAQQLTTAACVQLDTYSSTTGANSVPVALEADTTLGGVSESLIVDSFRPLNAEEVAGIGYWGGEFSVRVLAR